MIFGHDEARAKRARDAYAQRATKHLLSLPPDERKKRAAQVGAGALFGIVLIAELRARWKHAATCPDCSPLLRMATATRPTTKAHVAPSTETRQ